MYRFLLLPFTVPAERLVGRMRRLRASILPLEAHAPSGSPRFDYGAARHGTTGTGLLRRLFSSSDAGRPNDPSRRDSLRAGVGLPLMLFFLSAKAASGTIGCAAADGGSLGSNETVVDSFTVGRTSEDGMTLEEALYRRAEELGLEIYIAEDTVRDLYDCRQTYSGPRLLRWDLRDGSSTDYRYYRFVVYDETGEVIGNLPSLATILREGYTVLVIEAPPADDVADS